MKQSQQLLFVNVVGFVVVAAAVVVVESSKVRETEREWAFLFGRIRVFRAEKGSEFPRLSFSFFFYLFIFSLSRNFL
jgi:hypothetical protein